MTVSREGRYLARKLAFVVIGVAGMVFLYEFLLGYVAEAVDKDVANLLYETFDVMSISTVVFWLTRVLESHNGKIVVFVFDAIAIFLAHDIMKVF